MVCWVQAAQQDSWHRKPQLQALASRTALGGGWGGPVREGEGGLSVWYFLVGGERASSRLPAITRRVCYCRFINEACGNEDWLVQCVSWAVGEKEKSENGEQCSGLCSAFTTSLDSRQLLPLPPLWVQGAGGGEGMEGVEEGCCSFSVSLVPIFFFFRISTGHHFWCPWVTLGHFCQTDDHKTFFFRRRSAFPGFCWSRHGARRVYLACPLKRREHLRIPECGKVRKQGAPGNAPSCPIPALT